MDIRITPDKNIKVSNFTIKPNYMAKPYNVRLQQDSVELSKVYFTGNKTINDDTVFNEKIALYKQIDDILQAYIPQDFITIYSKLLHTRSKEIASKYRPKARKIYDKSSPDLLNIVTKALTTFFAMANETVAEAKKKSKAITDTKYDTELLNKFKSAISNDDLDLDRVYKNYYANLENIDKIEDLKTTYPKIVIPKRPEDIISKKIVDSFTKDVYLQCKEFSQKDDTDGILNCFANKFYDIIDDISKDTKLDKQMLVDRLLKPTSKMFFDKFLAIKENNSFTSIPEQHKKNFKIITPLDVKMLSIDYDNFVLSSLKKMYLDNQKPSQIIYQENGIKIKMTEVTDSGYKIEKPNDKIKSFIQSASKIKAHERDYEHSTSDYLHKRLDYYSRQQISNNDEMLNLLVDFEDCMFTKEDIQQLVKFLHILDDVSDKKLDLEQATEIIKNENIRPVGTDSINETERLEKLEILKAEQQKMAEYSAYCKRYDNIIDFLYRNNLDEIATIANTYRPQEVNHSQTASDKFLKLIKSYIVDGKINNVEQLKTKVKYLDKFYNYQKYDSEKPSFEKAINYSKEDFGKIDEIKIGQYLFASEILESYPQCMEELPQNQADILSIIKSKYIAHDEEIKMLIKYENFTNLPEEEQNKINVILDNFSLKNTATEKEILKYLTKNYSDNTTYIITALNGKNTIKSKFLPSAKQQIMDIKGFPLCLDYYEAFEDEMLHVASDRFSNGIHSLGSNNDALKKRYKQEVKIDMDERLYSTRGDFSFDVFGAGLHKLKNTKA